MSLRLGNIRSYVATEVGFGGGVTLFSGDIGSGKSTVLLAIEFALFGLGETDSAHLLRHGAEEGEVELVLDVGGRRVRALRTLKLRRTRAHVDRCVLDVDGEAAELTSAEMKARVLEVLGYDENPDPKAKSDIFRYSVYTPQEDMRDILDTRGRMREQRKETLRRALGIQDYRRARDNLSLVASGVRSAADELRGRASSVDQVRERLERERDELEQQRTTLGEAEARVHQAEERERRSAQRVETLEEWQGRVRGQERLLDAIMTDIAKARGEMELTLARLASAREARDRLQEVEARLEVLADVARELGELEGLEGRLSRLQAEYEAAVEELAGLRQELERARRGEERVGELEGRLDGLEDPEGRARELEDRRTRLEERLAGLRGGAARLEGELEALTTEAAELEGLEGAVVCPRCRQPLTGEHLRTVLREDGRRRRDLSSRLREASSRLHRLEGEREDLRREAEAIEGARREREDLARALEGAREEAARVPEVEAAIEANEGSRLKEELEGTRAALDPDRLRELRRLEAERVQLERRREELAGTAGDVPSLEGDLEGARKALEEGERRNAEASSALEALRGEHDPGDLAEARSAHQEAVGELGSAGTELRALHRRIADGEGRARELEAHVSELEEARERQRIHEQLHAWLTGCLRPALEEVERQVMAAMGEEMDAAARRWFELLVDDPDLELSVDEDFVPQVQQQGWDVEVTALSGGERTAVAFAYRLALNGLVRRIATPGQANLLMLDEPTDGFSREQLVRMGAVLRELEADQVVIVSHDREMEAFADRVFVVRKEEGSSTIAPAG